MKYGIGELIKLNDVYFIVAEHDFENNEYRLLDLSLQVPYHISMRYCDNCYVRG